MTVLTVAARSATTARHLRQLGDVVFASFVRSRQRERAEDYLRGMLAQPERKTVSAIASAAGCCKQSLAHFITDSPWDCELVQAASARELQRLAGRGRAWIVDDTGQAKQGKSSPGVQRQYSGTIGKIGNCQVAVSLNLAGALASGVLDWRLFMPASWDADKCRRTAARVPTGVLHIPKWMLALQMTKAALANGLKPLPVLGDTAYGENQKFRAGLDEQGLQYMLEVTGKLAAHPLSARPCQPARAGAGRPCKALIRKKARCLSSLARGRVLRSVPGLRGRFMAVRVRPAGRDIKPGVDGQLPDCWLVVWRRPNGERKYLLSNLPPNAKLKTLAQLACLRWRIEQDYRELKQCLGLAHFEGRTYDGWARHVALCGLARLLVLKALITPGDSFYQAVRSLRPLIIALNGHCPTCGQTAHSPPASTSPAAAPREK